jgi:archaellum biogenesis protein FlaJ (TadC family)
MLLFFAALVATALVGVGLLLFFLWQRRRPAEEKTYRLNFKTMAVAVLTEIIIAGAGIGAAFVWAFQSGNDAATRTIMIVGGLIFVGLRLPAFHAQSMSAQTRRASGAWRHFAGCCGRAEWMRSF